MDEWLSERLETDMNEWLIYGMIDWLNVKLIWRTGSNLQCDLLGHKHREWNHSIKTCSGVDGSSIHHRPSPGCRTPLASSFITLTGGEEKRHNDFMANNNDVDDCDDDYNNKYYYHLLLNIIKLITLPIADELFHHGRVAFRGSSTAVQSCPQGEIWSYPRWWWWWYDLMLLMMTMVMIMATTCIETGQDVVTLGQLRPQGEGDELVHEGRVCVDLQLDVRI